MYWLTLWLAWVSKMISFVESALKPPESAPKRPAPPSRPPESAPAKRESHFKREEAAPKPVASAAKPQETASKPMASAVKPQEAAPKPVATAPKPVASAVKPQETAPKPVVTAPRPQETAPEPIANAPKPQEIAAKPQEIAPQPEAPPRQEAASKPELSPKPAAAPRPEAAAKPELSPKPAGAPRPEAAAKLEPSPKLETTAKPQEIAAKPKEIAPKSEATARLETPTKPEPPRKPEAAPEHEPPRRPQPSVKEETGEGSMTWRKRPMIYEIPTWVWLDELRAKYGAGLTLGTIPAAEWDAITELAVDAVWLMGVWERSPKGVAVSNENADQQAEFRRVLPDYTLADNVGSAYCVRDYVVARHLGGPEALAQARAALNARGLRLILDFVPNHVAIDHPWALHYPEYFVRGTFEDLSRAPNAFVDVNGCVLANGRDPYFPPWRDVLQVNAFHPQLRAAAIETVSAIAAQCDGMRCDMAMLLLNEIFEHTWGHLAGTRPPTEYWQEVIPAVKAKYPNTLFIAEVYWDLEYEMMQKGFDYCYDKRLYDRLVGDNADSIRAHLSAGLDYQDRLVRFIENHDEPRAAATFHGARERAAAIVMATTPGAKLVYDGQIEGRQVMLPVFLARRRAEAPDSELVLFYHAVLAAVHADLFHDGEWHLCECSGWPDNASFHDIVAWTWRYRDQRTLVAVNLSGHRSQAMVHLPWDDLRGQTWRLVETLAWECYVRDGDDLSNSGLFVNLDAWGYHFLKFE